MCVPGQPPAAPSSAAEALAWLDSALGFLAQSDAHSLTLAEHAAVLRGLERAEARQTAARARVLSAFVSGGGLELDGHGSARAWLMWQTRVARGAASGAVGWLRRLAQHPAIADALAGGEVSASWARQLSEWTDLLPEHLRADADAILLGAVAAGADLRGLARLAEEMRERTAEPDTDDDGFTDRRLRLSTTLGGAGRLNGDLTPQATAALAAVLESLGKKAGPEDDRTQEQRDHDALEEACRRLTAGGLPDVAGQPTQVQLHMTLDQLRSLTGAAEAEAAWMAERAAGAAAAAADGAAGTDGAAGASAAGWMTSRTAAQAYACDAQLTPVVTGHVDRAALALTIRDLLRAQQRAAGVGGGQGSGGQGSGGQGSGGQGSGCGGGRGSAELSMAELEDIVLRYAADVLSGPAGLASALRTGLPGPQSVAVSLPLDVGTTPSTVPPHLRRAVTIKVKTVPPGTFFGPNYLNWTFSQDYYPYNPYLAQVAYSMLPGSPFNETHTDNPQYTDWYRQANATTNPALRTEILHQMQQFDFTQGGYIIPAYVDSLDAYSDKIAGYVPARVDEPLSNFDYARFYFTAG
jgi:hypothetical protein